jgi:hypothetical protein
MAMDSPSPLSKIYNIFWDKTFAKFGCFMTILPYNTPIYNLIVVWQNVPSGNFAKFAGLTTIILPWIIKLKLLYVQQFA